MVEKEECYTHLTYPGLKIKFESDNEEDTNKDVEIRLKRLNNIRIKFQNNRQKEKLYEDFLPFFFIEKTNEDSSVNSYSECQFYLPYSSFNELFCSKEALTINPKVLKDDIIKRVNAVVAEIISNAYANTDRNNYYKLLENINFPFHSKNISCKAFLKLDFIAVVGSSCKYINQEHLVAIDYNKKVEMHNSKNFDANAETIVLMEVGMNTETKYEMDTSKLSENQSKNSSKSNVEYFLPQILKYFMLASIVKKKNPTKNVLVLFVTNGQDSTYIQVLKRFYAGSLFNNIIFPLMMEYNILFYPAYFPCIAGIIRNNIEEEVSLKNQINDLSKNLQKKNDEFQKNLHDLEKKNEELEKKNEELEKKNDEYGKIIKDLKKKNDENIKESQHLNDMKKSILYFRRKFSMD